MTGYGDWIGPVAGAVGSYFGAQAGGPQTNTQSTGNPAMQGQWNAYQNFANQVANRPYMANPTQRVAGLTQDQYGAMDSVRNTANGGNGGMEMMGGSQALMGALAGPQANPYLNGLLRQTADDVQGRMGQAAFGSGSFGNSGVAAQTAKGLADSENNIRFQDYNNGMQRQMQAIPMALNYQNQRFQNANAQMQSGGMQQQQGQAYADDNSQRWEDWNNYPNKQLGIMGQPLGMNSGFSQQQTTQPGNRFASAVGGGLLGLQLGNGMAGGAQPRQDFGYQSPAPIVNTY
ncbi:MAG: hypothetical protein H0V63_07095 [Burkholderiaceae bacterium]|nr:hypothetical protein [Burkholderiaceae bacterium]